jgi:hypothetical protein
MVNTMAKRPLSSPAFAIRYASAIAVAVMESVVEQLSYRMVYENGDTDFRVDVSDILAIAAELRDATTADTQ